MNLYIVVLLLPFVVKPIDVVSDYVDMVEVNHFFDKQGRLIFDQVIFWEWNSSESRFHVRAWRLVKSPSQIPRRDGQLHRCCWHDGEVFREVTCRHVSETWTQYDPELLERNILPQDRRRDLSRYAQKKRPTPANRGR